MAGATANDETRAGGEPARGTKVRRKARPNPAPFSPQSEPQDALRAELRRWNLCRTFAHQFAVIARRVMPGPIIEDRNWRKRRGTWTACRITPQATPGLAAIKHAQQCGERETGLRQGFREVGRMTQGDAYKHLRRSRDVSLPVPNEPAAERALKMVRQRLSLVAD